MQRLKVDAYALKLVVRLLSFLLDSIALRIRVYRSSKLLGKHACKMAAHRGLGDISFWMSFVHNGM